MSFKWFLPSLLSVGRVYDADALLFLAVAAITDPVTIDAVNRLVLNAKAHGWWYKCNAIYPFVGGTSTTCKFNLKDPRDLDAAFRLTFNGGWTFASTGITGDAVLGTFAETNLIPSTTLSLNDLHLSIYSRTSAAGSATSSDIGATNSGTQEIRLILRRSNNSHFSIIEGTATTITATNIANGSGYWLGSRTTSSLQTLYRNGVSVGTNINNNTNTLPSVEVYIGATNNAIQGNTAREYAFATIGTGVNTTLAPIMYTDIQQFQTDLSRQV